MSLPARLHRGLLRLAGADRVRHRGWTLPPASLRFCDAAFRDDATFLEAAVQDVRTLRREVGLDAGTRLLEIGCGSGRLAIGIRAELGRLRRYVGVDVHAAAVRWCRRHLRRRDTGFEFLRLDMRHERYNPGGRDLAGEVRLPYPPQTFDLVVLLSVCSNLVEHDVVGFAREAARLMTPGGRVVLTAFTEADVPPATVNPEGYVVRPTGPLNLVRYERAHFRRLLESAGLRVLEEVRGGGYGGQARYVLARGDAPSP